MNSKIFFMLAFVCYSTVAQEKTYQFVVNSSKVGASIQPTMYGLFFEDINFAADGGLYAELVKNRSFEFPQALMGWKSFGKVDVRTEDAPFDRNPHYVRLSFTGHKDKQTGLENEGFRGIGIKKDNEYRFSIWAKSPEGTAQKIRVELVDSSNDPFEKREVEINSVVWKKYEFVFKPGVGDSHAVLRIFLATEGIVDIEHVSLFPVDTWKGRTNGLRKDLAEALYELSPGVFRFPGGCIVEGTELSDRYNWKNTLGMVENRPLNLNRWQYTFTQRFFPDYFQSYGLGFYEYFLLCEDLGAEPLPVINCGLACQYQNNGEHCHAPVNGLDEYIQDALDLIEFSNGPATSKWGKVRAEMGHPEPFNLKLIGVGNEQWGQEYTDRLPSFVKAIKERYPKIKIIGSSGPSPDGEKFEYLWPAMKRIKVDLVDEHYYRSPEWFLGNASRYDSYDRKGPKVFAGEYACHPKDRKNNFEAALCEAAFMTGLERNADVVHMTTYAPLFAHVDAWQWKPDLIWFDNMTCVRTPDYYVQKLYAVNKGTNVLPITLNKENVNGQDGLYASAVIDKDKKEIIIKICNVAVSPKNISLEIKGFKAGTLQHQVQIVSLHGKMGDENSIAHPNHIVPTLATSSLTGNILGIVADAQTFYVYTIKY